MTSAAMSQAEIFPKFLESIRSDRPRFPFLEDDFIETIEKFSRFSFSAIKAGNVLYSLFTPEGPEVDVFFIMFTYGGLEITIAPELTSDEKLNGYSFTCSIQDLDFEPRIKSNVSAREIELMLEASIAGYIAASASIRSLIVKSAIEDSYSNLSTVGEC